MQRKETGWDRVNQGGPRGPIYLKQALSRLVPRPLSPPPLIYFISQNKIFTLFNTLKTPDHGFCPHYLGRHEINYNVHHLIVAPFIGIFMESVVSTGLGIALV